MAKYNVYTLVDTDGKPVCNSYPYGGGEIQLKWFKEQEYKGKKYRYRTLNKEKGSAGCIGVDAFSPGQAKAITITEGADDMLSVYQMLGSKYACISVHSCSSAVADCKANYDFIDSFDKIYLCLDNDDHGKHATKDIAQLFDINKIYYVDLGCLNDANEYLQAKREDDFKALWYAAKRYKPKGIIHTFDEIKERIESINGDVLVEYPWPTLASLAYGIEDNAITLLTAPTGVGKTEIIRSLEHHSLTTTDHNIGVIHIEEDYKRYVQGIVGYELGEAIHKPDLQVSNKVLMREYEKLLKREDKLYMYSHFGTDDPSILMSSIRYLVKVCKCKIVFFDHLSIVATGTHTDDERVMLDRVCTELMHMVQDLEFALVMVSQVNDDHRTRGSRTIQHVAKTHIHMTRDLEHEDPAIRNQTRLMLRKNRIGSVTGPAGILSFNLDTFRINEGIPEEGPAF
jgi:twinkle protein